MVLQIVHKEIIMVFRFQRKTLKGHGHDINQKLFL